MTATRSDTRPVEDALEDASVDPLSPIKGIIIGAVLGAGMWLLLILLIKRLL